jgi:hypothetical protein
MDFNKLAARILVELKSAGYLAEFIHSTLNILAEADVIPPTANTEKLATALETLVQSDLFDVLLIQLLRDRKPPNVPQSATASWQSDILNPLNKTATRPAPVDKRAL